MSLVECNGLGFSSLQEGLELRFSLACRLNFISAEGLAAIIDSVEVISGLLYFTWF